MLLYDKPPRAISSKACVKQHGMVPLAGLEPATNGLGIRYSIL